MKTIVESLEEAYVGLQKSTDPEVSVVRRNLYLILEDLKSKAESGAKVEYFYNEKGDYTISLHDVNHVKSLTLRIDVLSKVKQFSLT